MIACEICESELMDIVNVIESDQLEAKISRLEAMIWILVAVAVAQTIIVFLEVLK